MTEEVTETEETEMVTRPVCVKPNFSKRIMGRASLVIFKVLISAVVRVDRARMRRRERGRKNCCLVIFPGDFGGGGGGEF